ncbi:MAG: A/G-specific adenine glycosylase [Bdellovibrionaceae bacterium]|nr:A/G-specific adenine glycosylase [Pseudobdellovibrionaceae bacterium]
MLQQTTSKAVVPYYNRFLKHFPDLKSLSKAKTEQVFSLWSGLGYYNRAKNLIKSSRIIYKQKFFPKTYKELLKFPGFGAYIARAVSSIAFEEPVGVLDGNVIRFLSRFYGLKIKHWQSKEKAELQKISDSWVQNQKSSKMNQALMEIGALICVKQKPLCLLCPVRVNCQAYKKGLQEKLPLKKEKKSTEFWHYYPEKIKRQHKWAFVKNTKMPFLKGHLLFPGLSKKLKHKATNYDFDHSIMNYKIFITIKTKRKHSLSLFKWYSSSEIKKLNPSSLIQKVLKF